MSTLLTPDILRTVAFNTSQFCTTCYNQVAAEYEAENLISSPLSVSLVLSMLTYGACENTEKELRSVLNFSDNDTINKHGYQTLIDTLNAFKSVQLKLANKIFVAKNFPIKSLFKQITENYFRSVTENIDFTENIEACKIINTWCEENTNNHITDLVQPDDINNSTLLVLVNAVYFKGNWAKQFNPARTTLKPFHIDKMTTKNVPMMQIQEEYKCDKLPELNARFIELPYQSNNENDAISMFIICPDEYDGLKTIESNLHKVNFAELHRSESVKSQVFLQLPKFKMESKIDLKSILIQMGVKDIFENTADFRQIADSPLSVSKVIQKAFVEVNEEGTEAAAVTVVIGLRCCALMPTSSFIVDRPFFFAIVATKTGTQLFNGRVIDPSST